MGRKFGLLIIISLFLLSGLLINFINRYYTFSYLFNHYFKREFSINPRVEMSPEKEYTVRIWYPPFYRTIVDKDEKELFKSFQESLKKIYPNITLKVACIDFHKAEKELKTALQEGRPPDIYLNLTDDYNLKDKYSVQVDTFLEKDEVQKLQPFFKEGKLNSFPFLIHHPGMIIKNHSEINNKKNLSFQDFKKLIEEQAPGKLVFNTGDQNLLKILLSYRGVNTFAINEGRVSGEIYSALKDIYEWLHSLRVEEYFAVSPVMMDDLFLKSYFTGEAEIIGPVNFYLERHLLQKKNDYKKIRLNNFSRIYFLNIFRQENYKGDDHTKAVMETARIMSKVFGEKLAEELGITAAFKYQDSEINVEKFAVNDGDSQNFWESKIIKGWNDFWEKGLSPKEVMKYYE